MHIFLGCKISLFFHFFRSGITPTCERAYTEAEISLHIGYYLGFQPHPGTRKDKSTPYSKHKDPFYYFCAQKIKTYSLGQLYTLAMLHHCISSVLCCKPKHSLCTQIPKNDYRHACSHPLSNLFIMPNRLSGACQFFVYSIFLVFHLCIQLPLIRSAAILYELSPEYASLAKALYKKT